MAYDRKNASCFSAWILYDLSRKSMAYNRGRFANIERTNNYFDKVNVTQNKRNLKE